MFDYFKRIVLFAKPYKEPFFLSILFNALYSIFAVFSLVALIPILKILFDQNIKKVTVAPLYNSSIEIKDYLYNWMYYLVNQHGSVKVLGWVCLTGFILFFCRNFFRFMGEYYLVSLKTGFNAELKKSIFQRLLQLPTSYYNSHSKGDLMARITADISVLESTYIGSFITVLRAPIAIIFPLIAMFAISTKLSLFAFIVLPLMGSVIAFTGKKLKAMSGKAMEYSARNNGIIDESLTAHKIIKIFRAENFKMNQFNELTNKARKLIRRFSRLYELSSPISELIGSAAILLLMWYGGVLIINQDSSFLEGETFIFFISLFYQVIDPAKSLITALNGMNSTKINAQRVFELLDTDLEIIDKPNAISIDSFNEGINFESVDFGYTPTKRLFNKLSFTIAKGQMVALVGASGGGKSSISGLLARFYDVQQGAITIDGKDIKDISLESYRGLMTMVTQEPLLFNESIANNISLGKPDATREEIIQAAKIALAHDFIEQLPTGYDTFIGDAGNLLSGGQKQRISIARAVLTNPQLLILDEATSALDSESEKAVQIALEKVMKDRTSVVIAHRLSTIQKADKIIVLEKGSILEQGTHQSLIQLNGKYAQLVRLQELGGDFE